MSTGEVLLIVAGIIVLGTAFAVLRVYVWEFLLYFVAVVLAIHFPELTRWMTGRQIASVVPPPTTYEQARARLADEYAAGQISYEELESKIYTVVANEETARSVRGSGDGI